MELDHRPRQQNLRPLLRTNAVSVEEAKAPIRVEFSASNWTAYAIAEDSLFGSSVARAGDVSGDGFDELIIGAPHWDGASDYIPNRGTVFLFQGSSNGPAKRVAWSFASPTPRAQLGFAVAGLGDINHDGYADVGFGAPRYDEGSMDSGAVYILLGGSSLATLAPPSKIIGREKRSWLGWSVASAGDLNRDGYDDFLAGAPVESVISPHSGAAFFYLGTNHVAAWQSHWAMRGDARDGQFGECIASAGDVNGDGYLDVIVGAPRHDKKLRQTGRSLLFQGSSHGPSDKPVWIADGSVEYGWFGEQVGCAGDVNHDGFSDVFVSAPGHKRPFSSWPGEISIYFGSRTGLMSTASIRFTGQQPGARFGAAVAFGGDINQDGLGDLVVGSPLHDALKADEGRVSLFFGTTNGFELQTSWVLDGGEAGAKCGSALAWIGDADQDGFGDFLVGTPHYSEVNTGGGRVDVFYGSATDYRAEIVSRTIASSTNGDSSYGSQQSSQFLSPASTPPDGSHSGLFSTIMIVLGVAAVAGGFIFVLSRRVASREQQADAAVETERHRLARDLHDDLGARLARISLLMELVNKDAAQTDEGRKNAQILAETTREVLASMEQILWSVDPANDTLENLVTFIVQYAGPFFAPTGIRCHHETPPQLPARNIQPAVRKNLFLAVKEALHNLAKHSGATEARIKITFSDPFLAIVIEDNGHGFTANEARAPKTVSVGDPRPRRGHGLDNMRARLEELGGQFFIEARGEGGTRVRLSVKV